MTGCVIRLSGADYLGTFLYGYLLKDWTMVPVVPRFSSLSGRSKQLGYSPPRGGSPLQPGVLFFAVHPVRSIFCKPWRRSHRCGLRDPQPTANYPLYLVHPISGDTGE